MASGAVWSCAASICSQGSSLAAMIISARILGVAQFGALGLIQTTVGMFGVLAGLGLGLTATRYVAETRAANPARTGRILGLVLALSVITSLLAAAALFVTAPILAARSLNAPHLTAPLRAASALLVCNALATTQVGALAGFEEFRGILGGTLVRAVVTLPATAAGAWLWGLTGAVWSLSVSAASQYVFNFAALRRTCRRHGISVNLGSALVEAPLLWRFSLPAVLSSSMTSPVLWLCSAMLANQPSGYAQLGIFAAATQWRNAVAFFPTVISNATLPILASVRATAQPLAYRGALIRNLTMALLSATMVAVPLAVWPHKLMGVYGTDFTTGSSVLVISAITGVLNSANAVIGTGIAAEAAMWWGFTFNCLWAAVLLLCARVLVPTGLALGLAEALLLAYLSHTVWQGTYLVLRLVKRRVLADDARVLQL